MNSPNSDFQSANEIGKIYQSLNDRTILAGFFLESVSKFIEADEGYLYLTGRNDNIWLDARFPASEEEVSQAIRDQAEKVFREGRPDLQPSRLSVPLLVRSDGIGVAVFFQKEEKKAFDQESMNLALGLSAQMAGAMKNILLLEENLKMERLAAVGQTTGMVIHEIKNIMQLAKLSYEFLKRGYDNKNEKFLERGMSNIEKALREMEGFTMDMLSLTKDYELETQPIEIAKVLNELQNDLKDKAAELKVRIDCEVPEAFGSVDADERSLYRTLLNLVKNALEASDPAKGDCYVKIKAVNAPEDRYILTIEDNGIGMTEEVRARLFEAFFSTKGSKGTGLGLLIIDRTVKKHHGHIDIESEKGKGTKFILNFPRKIGT